MMDLVATFADQAVIAIENARLFSGAGAAQRRFKRATSQVTEALDLQVATSRVLRVIASSPANVDQALNALITSLKRLTNADRVNVASLEGDDQVVLAHTWPSSVGFRHPAAGSVAERAIRERRTIHLFGTPEEQLAVYPESRSARLRTWAQAITPLVRDDRAIGSMMIARDQPPEFSAAEITRLETFATSRSWPSRMHGSSRKSRRSVGS